MNLVAYMPTCTLSLRRLQEQDKGKIEWLIQPRTLRGSPQVVQYSMCTFQVRVFKSRGRLGRTVYFGCSPQFWAMPKSLHASRHDLMSTPSVAPVQFTCRTMRLQWQMHHQLVNFWMSLISPRIQNESRVLSCT